MTPTDAIEPMSTLMAPIGSIAFCTMFLILSRRGQR